MGNIITSSKRPNAFQHLKDQTNGLGDQYPFGDDEILRIARCLAYLRHRPIALSENVIHYSFLNNWAVYCSTLPPADFTPDDANKVPFLNLLRVDENLIVKNSNNNNSNSNFDSSDSNVDVDVVVDETRANIRKCMLLVEEKILPQYFGQKLEEVIFALLVPSSASTSTSTSAPNATTNDKNINDDLAMQRLEKFLNGLANSSRRGSRKALAVIYDCCVAMRSTTTTTTNVNNNSHCDMNQKSASAKDLLDLSYRLSLASLVLGMMLKKKKDNQDANKNDNDDNQDDYDESIEVSEDNNDNNDDDEKSTAVTDENNMNEFDFSPYYPQQIDNSLVQSLIEFASKYSSSASTNNNYLSMTTGPTPGHSATSYMNNANGSDKKSQDNNDESDMVSLEAFTAWTESNAPCLSACMETFLHHIFFPDKPYPPSRMEFVFPQLRGQHSAFFTSKSSPLLFSFASMSPSLGGAWFRLYTSDEDGLSFNRLQNALLGYSGPTLLIIKEVEGGGIFGAFTSTAWKETKDFYGNSDCFLFQLQPNVKVIRPRGRGGNNFMYCNSESRSRGYDGQSHGIGFGGTTEKPRLFICESFDGCMASASDLTFEGGALLSPLNNGEDESKSTFMASPNRKYFDIESLEVWGVGGDDLVAAALGDRSQQREIAASNIQKARKVDKAAFLDDLRSGLIESKAFRHRDEMRGRGDCEADEVDKKGKSFVYAK